MASSNPVSPPMSHSAAYYDNRSSVRPLSHNHHYSPTLLHPQAAHLNPNPRSPTTPQRTEPRRVGGSVSSDESGSSTASETERYLHNKQYQYSPQVERGTWKEPVRHSYQPSQIGANLDRGSHTRSELVEDNSTVFRYIQPEASEEAKENDHAFWILVRSLQHRSSKPHTNTVTDRSGYLSSTLSTASSAPYIPSSPFSPSSYCSRSDCAGANAHQPSP